VLLLGGAVLLLLWGGVGVLGGRHQGALLLVVVPLLLLLLLLHKSGLMLQHGWVGTKRHPRPHLMVRHAVVQERVGHVEHLPARGTCTPCCLLHHRLPKHAHPPLRQEERRGTACRCECRCAITRGPCIVASTPALMGVG
jgi:hypothetical protein